MVAGVLGGRGSGPSRGGGTSGLGPPRAPSRSTEVVGHSEGWRSAATRDVTLAPPGVAQPTYDRARPINLRRSSWARRDCLRTILRTPHRSTSTVASEEEDARARHVVADLRAAY